MTNVIDPTNVVPGAHTLDNPELPPVTETPEIESEPALPVPFCDVVGQPQAKGRLGFYLDGYKGNGIIPHLLFVAAKGQGKTLLAREMARNLRYVCPETGKLRSKKFIEINCSTVKSVSQLFTDVIMNYVHDKYCTVLFDEASELPRDVSMAFLTVLNPNPTNQTSFSTDNFTFNFDFRMQTFLFATSEPQKVFHALADRLDRVELEDYSLEDLSRIVRRNFQDVNIADETMFKIASVLRGNARAAQNMATKMKTQLGTKTPDLRGDFTADDWTSLKTKLTIMPLGLLPLELRVLRLLGERRTMTLTTIAAALSMTPSSVRRDIETHLLKLGLMQIGQLSKRELTPQGQAYLRELNGAPAIHTPA